MGKVFGDIAAVVSPYFDTMSLSWVNESREFEFKDIYRVQKGQFFSKDRYVVDSMFDTLISLN